MDGKEESEREAESRAQWWIIEATFVNGSCANSAEKLLDAIKTDR